MRSPTAFAPGPNHTFAGGATFAHRAPQRFAPAPRRFAPRAPRRVAPQAPRRFASRARRRVAAAPALLAAVALLAGCGKSLPSAAAGNRGVYVTTVAGTNQLAASGLATKNTTRLGGENAVADAAAVALATYPGLTPATRPRTVVVVNDRDWAAALAASALASAPLRAPLLYSEGDSLPSLTAQALAALKPTGDPALGGAQVIAVGTGAVPARYRTLALAAPEGSSPASNGSGSSPAPEGSSPAPATEGSSPAPGNSSASRPGASAARLEELLQASSLTAQIERLLARLQHGPPRRVLVVGADGPAALAMPAAGLAAESGTPILPVFALGVTRKTQRVLERLRRPTIYAIGPPAAVSHPMMAQLSRFGPTRRIYPAPGANGATGPGTGGVDAADNAIAVARYVDGDFGWGVDDPGHGLVFASASRPLDAPAAAPLSANGDYAPLLLLEAPNRVPAALSEYLRDIQPAYTDAPEYQPVRGAYNHGWLIGDASVITPTVQAELDAMLEISPQSSSGSASGEAGGEPSGAGSPSTTATPSTTTPTTTTESAPTEPTNVTP